MTSQSCQQSTAIHILANTSRSKDNQTLKFEQLIEYNMTNIFLEKPFTYDGETIPRLFSENKNRAYLWINSLKFCTTCFDCMPSWGRSKYIETKLKTTCF